jgi:hypothetical protein
MAAALHDSNAFSNACSHGEDRSCSGTTGALSRPVQAKENVMSINEQKLNEFLGRAVVDIGATLHAGLVVMGEKLGLYKTLAAATATSQRSFSGSRS